LWGGQYERKLAEVLRLQSDIAQEISLGLRLKLTDAQKQLLAKRYTDNNEAYQLYLLGRFQRNQRANQKAIDYFEQAIQKDSNYAPAYAQLAYTYASASDSDWLPRKEARERMDSPALHTDLGKILYSASQRDQAMEQYRKALELNPNYFGAHHHLANFYLAEGRYEEAIAEAEKMNANAPNELSERPFLGYTYAIA